MNRLDGGANKLCRNFPFIKVGCLESVDQRNELLE